MSDFQDVQMYLRVLSLPKNNNHAFFFQEKSDSIFSRTESTRIAEPNVVGLIS